MSRISEAFKRTKKALIVFIMAGDPNLDETDKLIEEIERSGVDIIELGIPFSDSVADGPTIQEAANRALAYKTTAKKCIQLVKKVRERSEIPIAFMTSFNIIYKYGTDKFIADCVKAGVDGLVIPDLSVEEASLISGKGLDTIFLFAPNSSPSHIRMVAKNSTGFIYAISISGITGARNKMHMQIGDALNSMKGQTDKPVAIGFGISNEKQAKEAAKLADGIIVGSAVIDMIQKNRKNLGKFLFGLKKAIIS